jgi:zinc-binding alcohol dehydrogenase/oxidoreductase
MKATVFDQSNFSIRIEEVPMPELKAGQVLIKIKAASLNHHELWYMKQKNQPKDLKIIPGADGSGDVIEIGPEVDSSWLGKRVIINPSLIPTKKEMDHECDLEILGYAKQGTFAEYIAVDERYIYEIPAHLSYEEAAAVPLAGLTAYRALFSRGQIIRKSTILITSIGGSVALWALAFALKMDVKVYVTSGHDDKIQRAILAGACGGANYKKSNWKKELYEKTHGFDLILDGAAGTGFEILLHLVKAGGKIISFGRTAGPIPSFNPKLIFLKQITIMGTTMGNDVEFKNMLYYLLYHQLRPIIDSVYTFDDIHSALARMESGDHFGKIVLRM